MIVSHQHRFIFVKTRKTAGTSIEIALSKFCGPDDIITAISPEDEDKRRARGYRGPQNDLLPASHYTAGEWIRRVFTGRPARCYNHMPADRIRRLVGEDCWRAYYKFCVERNPWDKAVSLYYFRTRHGQTRPPLDIWLQTFPQHKLSDYHRYHIGGERAVDEVLRYESLAEGLERVRQRLGLSAPIELPRAKGQYRQAGSSYRELLGPADREIVARACAREIAELGYEF